jgi:RNA polymerase sigma-70 factor (ECF subfamily)
MAIPVNRPVGAADFERYRHQVYRWAYRVLGSHHDALDVAQDVFLQWTATSDAAIEHPRAWLRQVTIHCAIDVLRMRRRHEGLDGSAVEREDEVVGGGLERAEIRRHVAAALVELTDMQRRVLMAKVYGERTFASIAEDLGIAVPTAKTHYLRGLRAVRDRLIIETRRQERDR